LPAEVEACSKGELEIAGVMEEAEVEGMEVEVEAMEGGETLVGEGLGVVVVILVEAGMEVD